MPGTLAEPMLVERTKGFRLTVELGTTNPPYSRYYKSTL